MNNGESVEDDLLDRHDKAKLKKEELLARNKKKKQKKKKTNDNTEKIYAEFVEARGDKWMLGYETSSSDEDADKEITDLLLGGSKKKSGMFPGNELI